MLISPNRPMMTQLRFSRFLPLSFICLAFACSSAASDDSQNWPGFRGPGGAGVQEGYSLPTTWNADPGSRNQEGVLWRVPIPGLGHSSPVVWGDRVFVCTAIPEGEAAEFTSCDQRGD